MLTTIKRDWRGVLLQSVVGAVVLIAFLVAATSLTGGFAREREANEVARALVIVNEEARNAGLATACVLALPVSPETGRKPGAVRQCFTQYDLKPPQLVVTRVPKDKWRADWEPTWEPKRVRRVVIIQPTGSGGGGGGNASGGNQGGGGNGCADPNPAGKCPPGKN